MKWYRKAQIIKKATGKAQAVPFPLPEGKPETRNVFGNMKRWNTATGKYDLPA